MALKMAQWCRSLRNSRSNGHKFNAIRYHICLQIQYHEPTPPDTPLELVSKVVSVEQNKLTGKHKVTVELSLSHQEPGDVRKILVSGRGIFTKRGASRSL